jgi:hypothetical protein
MAIRLVFNAAYNSHTEPLFKSAAVLPLASLIEYFLPAVYATFFYRDFSLFPLMKLRLLIYFTGKKTFKLNFEMIPTFTYHLLVLL